MLKVDTGTNSIFASPDMVHLRPNANIFVLVSIKVNRYGYFDTMFNLATVSKIANELGH